MSRAVYITASAAFLPNAPVDNTRIELVLGQVGPRPSRAKRIVLKSNGIKLRHYALDGATRVATHSNAEMTAAAVQALFAPGEVQTTALVCGTSTPDQTMPNHAVMVHGELGVPIREVVATSGICLSGLSALKFAYLGVTAGDYDSAVATGSDLPSALLRAESFAPESAAQLRQLQEHRELAFEKDFLRWMLSDGAGALLLEPRARLPSLALRIDWIDLFSAADVLPTCMYAGAQECQGRIVGWMQLDAQARAAAPVMAIKQDVRLLNDNVVRACFENPLRDLMARRNLVQGPIDWFLPHMSSMYFAPALAAVVKSLALPIADTAWFTNLCRCGNTGAASIYIMLDELLHSGRLKQGQTILCMVPESGRFSSGFMHLTVCQG
ncbi:beta-ketoacyl-ACP synthase III [Candidatus Thiodictyon syntrophicum]|jgi:3-oxoacyl-[acyl-carrier-protein] synthase-3|uniref:Beta-ketoacyl-[acyl-carrier-protein] synthase III C-terminal domain-containing protein n=1 Tax=Candidatus Thiodictyon syntrophicum TaxID=1166950 RepID=A0A2K8U398_9GAMM|nr:beta-ketoacyl-ACP synthase III [Candidatus Thiodictyon syntrophicum]AUB80015.1 hypothetical protein THSYN_02905 [Candidatus Thiodictyon syntrophicum]